MHEEGGGIDSTNIIEWAQKFVLIVQDLTRNGRHILLVYDVYAAHMVYRVLEMFSSNRVVVYALPSYTSSKTEPLDTVVFSVFKRELVNAISATVQPHGTV